LTDQGKSFSYREHLSFKKIILTKQQQNFLNEETGIAENKSSEYVLRLLVTGASPNSVRAIINLKISVKLI